MHKAIIGFTAAASLALVASAAQACDWHDNDVSASVGETVEEGVAMSTHSGTLPSPIVVADDAAAEAQAAPVCAEGDKDCAPPSE